MKKLLKTLVFLSLMTPAMISVSRAQETQNEFTDWQGISHKTPEWFKDAKFGIYFHWGVYTVPAYDSEWYSRNMYIPGNKVYEHQLGTYGPLDEFGYKDFIPIFKAENFDPEAWAELFAKAGAQFAGPVAEHADGFSMWDSRVNPWNAKDMGPGLDVVGVMAEAIRAQGMKFVTTFHHQWHWGWYPTFNEDVDAGNPKYAGLYGPEVTKAVWQHDSPERPGEEFCELWWQKVKEVIIGYQPDIIYFDSRLDFIAEPWRKEMVTYYLGKMETWNKKGVILYKNKDLPVQVGVKNYEKSRMNKMGERLWQTEEPISTYSWSYTRNMELRPAEDILHGMIDVVSKNGVYLLNIAPKSDGTIPAAQKEILLAIGEWLQKYGESIYGTRPWYTYGEGPRKEAETDQDDTEKEYFELKYTAKDIRYTTKENIIYAILLGGSQAGENILLEAFSRENTPVKVEVTDVVLLGSQAKIAWKDTDNGLAITVPDTLSFGADLMATVFKVSVR